MQWDKRTRKFIEESEKINRGHNYSYYLQKEVDKGNMTNMQMEGYLADHRHYKHVKVMQCEKLKEK